MTAALITRRIPPMSVEYNRVRRSRSDTVIQI
jgi:hypothetical protein